MNNFSAGHRLSRALLIWVLAISSVLALLSTFAQLAWDYHQGVEDSKHQVSLIQGSYLTPIASSLWNMDSEQLKLQLDGLKKIPDVISATVYEKIDAHMLERASVGIKPKHHQLTERLPLRFEGYDVGELEINITLDPLYERLWEKSLLILCAQLLKTFLASILILLVFWRLLVRHLYQITDYIQQVDISATTEKLQLHRIKQSHAPDELDQIVNSINEMYQRNYLIWKTQQETSETLRQEQLCHRELADTLERKVAERTEILERKHAELEKAYTALSHAEKSLAENERAATLGTMVSGMTHELSTPMIRALNRINQLSDNQQKQPEIAEIREQLRHAIEYLNHFRQIALTHQQQQITEFNLAELFHQTLLSLHDPLKSAKFHLRFHGDPSLTLTNDANALARVLYQLIQNAIDHAFLEFAPENEVQFMVSIHDQNVVVVYEDNGVGIAEDCVPRLFQPYAFQQPEKGQSGLGCYLIFNQVTQLLCGSVLYEPRPQRGVRFTIEIPIQHHKKPALKAVSV